MINSTEAGAKWLVTRAVCLSIIVSLSTSPAHAQTTNRKKTSTQTSPKFLALVRDILVAALPTDYDEKKDWGKTTEIISGLKIQRKGLRIYTKRRRKQVNHGLWKHYRVSLAPGESLQLDVQNVRKTPEGRLAFDTMVTAKLRGSANWMHYQRGVRLYSIRAECDTKVRMRLSCEVTLKTERGLILPNLSIDPRVTKSTIEIEQFELRRVGKIEGAVARKIGDALEDAVRREVRKRQGKITSKINRSIMKRRDKLRFSAEEFLRDQWSKVAERLKTPTDTNKANQAK